MTTRAQAQAAHERYTALVAEVAADYCANSYGGTPCIAGPLLASGTLSAASPISATLQYGTGYSGGPYGIAITSGSGAGRMKTILGYVKNMATYTEDFTAAAWNASCTVTAAAATDPYGRMVATMLTDNSSTAFLRVSESCGAGTMNGVYCASLYVLKDAVGRATRFPTLRIQFTDGGGLSLCDISFDTATGEYVNSQGLNGHINGAGVIDCGIYWRVWVAAYDTDATITDIAYIFYPAVGTGSAWISSVSSTGSCIVWGAQLEKATTPGEYVHNNAQSCWGVITGRWENNWLLYSQQFSQAQWGRNNISAVYDNATQAPDGSMTASKIVCNGVADSGIWQVYDTGSNLSGKVFTFSAWVWTDGGQADQNCQLYIYDGAATHMGYLVFTMPKVPTRLRLTYTFPAGSIGNIITVRIDPPQAAPAGTYCYAWGAQLDYGYDLTDYVPTTTSSVFGPNNASTYRIVNLANACYKTYGTCQDKPHYTRGVKTYKFGLRGQAIPPGETVRPYVLSYAPTPTEIPVGGGLGTRSQATLVLADEISSDIECDPYAATRATPGGTYWTRFIARNYNLAGRPLRIRKGYVTTPWDWATFQAELYQVASLATDAQGNVQIVLTDPIKPLDQNMLPVPTDGKLAAALKALEVSGYAVAGAAATITLPAAASAIDGYYVGMECYVTQNTGAGQRRVISAYVGATRVATVSVAWSVVPDTTSVVEVSALNINVGTGKGTQYADPVGTGLAQFVRIGDEVIRYTAIAGDVLSWPDSSYRAQFGTLRQDSSAGDGVQLCFAPINKSVTDVIHRLINACGIADAAIDLAGLAQEDTDWYGAAALITTCISAPEKASGLLNELLVDLGMQSWWDAVAQQQRFKADMPALASPVTITPDETIGKTISITPLDSLRITRMYLGFAPYSATANMSESKNFAVTDGYIDAAAESPQEYNGIISQMKYSRWLTAQNQLFALSRVTRQVKRLRDAPFKVRFSLDPRNEVHLGDVIDVTTRKKTDLAGNPIASRMRVTKYLDDKNISIEAVSTTYFSRYAFIAPAGTPDYPTDTNYAHISSTAGLMNDGTEGYVII